MRKIGLSLGITAIVVFAVVSIYPRLFTHTIEIKAYLQDANGLPAGAPVRLAGVDVGKVTSVRARPEMHE